MDPRKGYRHVDQSNSFAEHVFILQCMYLDALGSKTTRLNRRPQRSRNDDDAKLRLCDIDCSDTLRCCFGGIDRSLELTQARDEVDRSASKAFVETQDFEIRRFQRSLAEFPPNTHRRRFVVARLLLAVSLVLSRKANKAGGM